MTNLEIKEENQFIAAVQDFLYPAIALKLILSGVRGWPDVTVLCKGQIIFFEFKRSKKRNAYEQTSQQGRWQRLLERLGFKYFVVYTAREATELFHENIKGLK